MASFAERLIAAHQAGLADKRAADQQAFEKQLRDFQVAQLKHEQGRFKLLDQIDELKLAAEQNAAAKQQLDLMTGQPGQVVPDTTPDASGEVTGGTRVLPHAPITFQGPSGPFQATPPTLQEILQQRNLAARAEALNKISTEPQFAGEAGRIYNRFTGEISSEAPVKPVSGPNTPFEVWRATHPMSPVEDWLKLTQRQSTANEPLVPTVDKVTGQTVYTPRSQAAGAQVPTSSQNKPPTSAERKILGFYERVSNAMDSLGQMEPDVVKMDTLDQLRLRFAPNLVQSPLGKRYVQAKNDFINASLRRESGAAISDGEYKRFDQIYFPQPGDDEATLAQKKRARDIQLASFKTEAGKAFTEKYGDETTGASGAKAADPLGIR